MGGLPLERLDVRLAADPRRVIAKPFWPREAILSDGRSRFAAIVARLLAMDDVHVDSTLAQTFAAFAERHRDLDALLEQRFTDVAARLTEQGIPVEALPEARRHLLAAYFTHEYSIEAAALTNPSIVASPDQSGVAEGELRFVMSLRAIGEGHVSSIEFRTGVTGPGGTTVEPAGHFAEIGVTTGQPSASFDYEVAFAARTSLAERVLFPAAPTESHGMEDARFVRFVEDDGSVRYYATYTAYDGYQILPRLLETDDFVRFRASAMSGPAARNKGVALFPRRIGGEFVALGRQDNVNNFVMRSDDVRVWQSKELIQEPKAPWELMQLGNCGSPIETEAGWLVITHGVGPFRTYSLGALLLDLDDPHRVVGHLTEPLLSPAADEREGYVPNVVYSCGSLVHAGKLVVPYGCADASTRLATIELDLLLDRLTGSARP